MVKVTQDIESAPWVSDADRVAWERDFLLYGQAYKCLTSDGKAQYIDINNFRSLGE